MIFHIGVIRREILLYDYNGNKVSSDLGYLMNGAAPLPRPLWVILRALCSVVEPDWLTAMALLGCPLR